MKPRLREIRFVDLFAGLGGFHVGLSRLRGVQARCVFACEIEDDLRRLYEFNFGTPCAGDIRNVAEGDIPRHDMLCAGFPCQPFSKAGEQLGLKCDRDGDLFLEHILPIMAYHLPRYVILENVPNLERHRGGSTYAMMRAEVEALGYEVDEHVLSPHKFGIPQIRERLFIVGCLSGLAHFDWPRGAYPTPSIFDVLDEDHDDARPISNHHADCLDVWQDFLDRFPSDEELPSFPIWSAEFGADYPFEDTTPAKLTARQLCGYRGSHGVPLRSLSPCERMEGLPAYARVQTFAKWKQDFIRQNRELYARHKSWMRPWIKGIKRFAPSLQKFEWNCKGEPRSLAEHVIQFRASGVRVKRATTAPALIAMTTTQVPVIGRSRRYMTVRECSRLQGLGHLKHLPTVSSKAYRALGNAVCSHLVRRVAARLVQRSHAQSSRSHFHNRCAVTRG